MLPPMLYYDHLPAESQEKVTKKIVKFYLGDGTYDESKKQSLTDMFSDSFFAAAMIQVLKYRFKYHNAKTFVYQFSHKGESSISSYFGDEENWYGTCHGDDLIYLFPMHKTVPFVYSAIPTEEDRALSRSMVRYWIDFAEYG